MGYVPILFIVFMMEGNEMIGIILNILNMFYGYEDEYKNSELNGFLLCDGSMFSRVMTLDNGTEIYERVKL